MAAVTLAAVLPVAALIALLVRVETGGVLVAQTRDRRARPAHDGAEVPHRVAPGRWPVPGTTWSVAISGRVGPIGRLLRRTRLDTLPALVHTLYRRMVRPSATTAHTWGSASPPRTNQAKVEAGQLTR